MNRNVKSSQQYPENTFDLGYLAMLSFGFLRKKVVLHFLSVNTTNVLFHFLVPEVS